MTIEVTQKAHPESRDLIARRLQEFNAPHLGDHPFGTLDVYLRDTDGQLVGGLIGEFAFRWFSIHVLWIAESLRLSGLEHFHNCCGADWLICGRLAIGLLDSAPQAKRIANPLQDTILPHNICENAL
jgi:hypothetical protein